MAQPETLTLEGVLDRFLYVSDDGSFVVAAVTLEGGEKTTAVGLLLGMETGEPVRLIGQWVDNPRFGKQFKLEAAYPIMPHTEVGVERYLASGRVKGVGREMARRLVATFGAETLTVIQAQPERLVEVQGIGPKRSRELCETLGDQINLREALVFLQGHDVPPALAARIFRRYENNTIALVRENPYRLAEEVRGVGFATADRIARTLGFSADDPARAAAALIHTLGAAQDEGHVCLPREVLVARTVRLVGPDSPVEAVLAKTLAEDRLVDGGDDLLYTRSMFAYEVEAAERVRTLLAESLPELSTELPRLHAASGIDLAPAQLEAVRAAARESVLVITGGPGTGKTTVVRTLLELFKAHEATVLLAAPTGRAARRMAEATGQEARTLHRLLEFNPPDASFRKGEDDPLDAAVVIIDEASMVDLPMFCSLLRAVQPGTRLIMVGDADQLPSVGAGNVLADLLACEVVPVVRLVEIFRQAELSDIVVAAHHILAGRSPEVTASGVESDFYRIEARDSAHAAALVEQLVADRVPAKFGVAADDVQVLTPMHRGTCGAKQLNAVLQQRLNPEGQPIAKSGLRVGDKVMQTRNDYERDVFNGDVGRVLGVQGASVTVAFEGRTVSFKTDRLNSLMLAYACTVHKSQGSEYPAVVVPLLGEHWVMLQRNLLYTAITRGRSLVVLVGQKRAIDRAVRNLEGLQRHTALARRLWGPRT
jgi:exodeoxyribonuclease V alpha subunit